MANTILELVATGTGNQFVVNFPLGIIDREDVTCRVAGEVDGGGNPVYRTITWLTDNTVQVSGSTITAGSIVYFTRTVDKDELVNNYADGAGTTAVNLNNSFKQALMAVQEITDGRLEAPLVNDLNMGGKRITNIGAPVNSADVARLSDLNDIVLAAGNVPVPTLADVNKYLRADGVGSYVWDSVDEVSVLDFGADPSGTVSSNAAFTAAANASRFVLVPDIDPATGLQAVYRLDNWAPPRNGIWIFGRKSINHVTGSPGPAIKKLSGATGNIIDLSTRDHIRLSNLIIDGVDRSVDGIKQGGDDHMFENLTIRTTYYALRGHSQTTQILQCFIYNNVIGIKDPVDTIILGGHITYNATYGIMCTSGSSANTFLCRNEWNGHGGSGGTTYPTGGNLYVFEGEYNTVGGTLDAGYNYNIRLIRANVFYSNAIQRRGGRSGSTDPDKNCNTMIDAASTNVVIDGILMGGYEDGGTVLYSPNYDVVISGGTSSANGNIRIAAQLVGGAIADVYETGAQSTNLVVSGSTQYRNTDYSHVKTDVRLYLDGTDLRLIPYNGRYLTVNRIWRAVPTAGITLGTGGLGANQSYYIYAYWDTATRELKLSASSTAPVTNSDGQLVHGTDSTRSYVGYARTNSSAWIDTEQYRYVRSAYNEKPLFARAHYTADRSVSATSAFTELTGGDEIRVRFLHVPGDVFEVTALLSGVSTSTITSAIRVGISLAGSSSIDGRAITRISGDPVTAGSSVSGAPLNYTHEFTTYGATFFTLMGRMTSGTGTLVGASSTPSTTGTGATTLTVKKL